MANQNIIAVIFDCDDTLCPDTTTFLINSYGVNPSVFWGEVNTMVQQGWDPPLAYMSKIIDLVENGTITDLTNEKLREVGSRLKLFSGIPRIFEWLPIFVKRYRRL